MKKFITLITILFAFHLTVFSQSTFQKVITVQGYPDFISTGVHKCTDGGYILCGYDGATADVGFIIKTDAAFQVLWVKKLEDPNSLGLSVYNIGECTGGGYYAMGYFIDLNFSTSCFLLKMDVSGNLLWNRQYEMTQGDQIYGSVAPKARELSSGEFLISTAMYGSMGVIKTDANGNIVFAKSFIGDTLEPKDPGLDAVLCNDGGIITAGKRGDDPYLVKTDAVGNIQWSKIFAMPNFYNRIYRMLPTSDGGYLAAGMKYGQVMAGFLLKINSTGDVIWYKEYVSSGLFYFIDMKQLASGGLLLLGQDQTTNQKVVVITDINGTIQSSRAIGIANSFAFFQYYPGFEVSAQDEVSLTYSSYDSLGNNHTYFFGSDNLNFTWCDVSNYSITENSVSYTPVISSGAFIQPINLSANSFTATQTVSVTFEDYCFNSTINDFSVQSNYSIFPNPITVSATIIVDQSLINKNVVFVLFDMLGNEVKKTEIINQQTEFEKGTLPAGCYLYKIISENEIIGNGKIIIAD